MAWRLLAIAFKKEKNNFENACQLAPTPPKKQKQKQNKTKANKQTKLKKTSVWNFSCFLF